MRDSRWNRVRRPLDARSARCGRLRAVRASSRRYRRGMNAFPDRAADYGRAAFEAIAETLWPTRCAVCDVPGAVLCESCKIRLPYLDWWRACPRCGAPLGRAQCTECNATVLAPLESARRPPFASCASSIAFDDAGARIVRAYKDQGERRLAVEMADLMARVIHPAWRAEQPVLVGVPATARAVRRRGFDHVELLARELSAATGMPLRATPRPPALHRPARAATAPSAQRTWRRRSRRCPGRAFPSGRF